MGNERIYFYEFLQAYLESNKVNVSMDDAEDLMGEAVKRIVELGEARSGFLRETVKMDGKGRVCVPQSMRIRLGWTPGEYREVEYMPKYKGVLVR